jgi:hypothetical protein
MDIHRLFIILSISLVFITLFCDDYLIEGAVGDNNSLVLDSTVDQTTSGDGQRSEVDVTLSGERSSDVRSTSKMNSSTNKNEDLTINVKKKDEVSKDGEIFGMDCVTKCTDYYHSCEAKTEYERNHRGKKRAKTTYGHIEECPNGQLPDKSCDTKGWFCKTCDEGYYPMKGVCKKKPNTIVVFIVLILLGVLAILFILGREYIFAAVRGAGDKMGRGTMDIRVVDGNKI